MMVKLKDPDKKENAKDVERQAKKRGWKIAGGCALGTGFLMAFLMGRCSTEPPMKCPEPDPVKAVPCELEQGAHVDSLCGNGVIDKGVFTVLVRVEGKKGEPATYKLAKIKIDERKRGSPFYCRKDLGKRKKPKRKGYGMSGSSKTTKGKHVAMISPPGPSSSECGPKTKQTAGNLIARVTGQTTRSADPLREESGAGLQPLQVTFALKISSDGIPSVLGGAVKCSGKRCPQDMSAGELRRTVRLNLQGIVIPSPEEGECKITIRVPVAAQ